MASKQAQQKTSGKREMHGTVAKKSGAKTVAVHVTRTIRHPVYHKQVRRVSKFLAHDESDTLDVGDAVVIRESRPLSARKRWIVVQNTKR